MDWSAPHWPARCRYRPMPADFCAAYAAFDEGSGHGLILAPTVIPGGAPLAARREGDPGWMDRA